MKIRIAGTVNESIVDGPGFRYTIFTRGCPHHCKGCHNPQTHDFSGGRIADTDDFLKEIEKDPLLDGVTFSGGEPFCQAHILAELGREVKKLGMDIITYTGYTFEQLYEKREQNGWGELLEVTDYLIDGPFILAQKDWEIKFRGSSNQRIIDVNKSLKSCQTVLWDGAMTNKESFNQW